MRAAKTREPKEGGKHPTPAPHPEWSQLLIDAVDKPGVLSDAYRRFWNYSTGNQLLALWQCTLRGLEPGPIHTFQGWKSLGRHVKKGEKAITLCMPVTVRRKRETTGALGPVRVGDGAERQITGPGGIVPITDGGEADSAARVTVFTYKPRWFLLCQTEGADYVPADLPEWKEGRALEALKITREPFRHPDGNTQGYAYDHVVSVSPVAFAPHRTLLHELAHVVLGHTEELGRMVDGDATPTNLREVEAEAVALICCECLGLPGSEHSRGYIQHWLRGQSIPDRSAQKAFRAADTVLKAGRPADATPAQSQPPP